MEQYKVVFASTSEEEVAALGGALEKTGRFKLAATVSDGVACVRAAMTERPDLVILDLALWDLNGLTVMERISALMLAPPVLVALGTGAEELRDQALAAGAHRYYQLPVKESAFAACVTALMTPAASYFDRDTVDYEVTRLCQELGAPMAVLGFACVQAGVRLGLRRPEMARRSYTALYPAIAAACGCQVSHVERNLRTFLESLYQNGNLAALERYRLDTLTKPATGRPTSSTFLKAMTALVLHDLQARKAREGERLEQSL